MIKIIREDLDTRQTQTLPDQVNYEYSNLNNDKYVTVISIYFYMLSFIKLQILHDQTIDSFSDDSSHDIDLISPTKDPLVTVQKLEVDSNTPGDSGFRKLFYLNYRYFKT